MTVGLTTSARRFPLVMVGQRKKFQRALKAQIDPEVFERMQGTVSFPFQPGEHKRIAVKVIDFRGNEVVRVVELAAGGRTYGP